MFIGNAERYWKIGETVRPHGAWMIALSVTL
jgi:hypothetical protein